MIQRCSLGFSRHVRVGRNRHGGFSRVGVLAVIVIVAVLVGLLLMYLNRSRESSRRSACIRNQHQLAKGIMDYATAKKKIPPAFSVQPLSSPIDSVGWIPRLLPYIDQDQLYQVFESNTWSTQATAQVPALVCPSREPTGSPAPLTYVVNCGMPDNTIEPLDYQANGVFFDLYTPAKNSRILPVTTDFAYISDHDGTTNTILLSENLDALDWITPGNPTPYGPLRLPQDGQTWWQGIIWFVQPSPQVIWGFGNSAPTGILLNKNTGTTAQAATDAVNARPSSGHAGGFIVTMCDGRSRFLNEDIEYRVYCLLMAPDNASAKDPLNSSFKYPRSWLNKAGTGLAPIADKDLQKK